MNLILIELKYANNNRGRLWVTHAELLDLCLALEKSEHVYSFVVRDNGTLVIPDSMTYNWTKWSVR